MEMDAESGTSTVISKGCRRCINNHSIELVNNLRTKNVFCDAVLRFEDGRNFSVHRLILSLHSDYFMTIFRTPFYCTQMTDVALSGVTSDTMNLILEYVYMRNLDINQENVFTLLVSADYLRMPGLLELCWDFLKRMTLTPENCIGIMRFARPYSSSLEEVARCFVMRNFGKVSQQSDEFLELPPEELKAIVGADELYVKSEEVVWNGVLRWINHDKENRKGNIVELIKKVRLGLLDPNFVLKSVKDHPYVAGNNECCAVIMDALKSPLGLEMKTQNEWEIPDRENTRPRIQPETLFVITECTSHRDVDYILTYDTWANRFVDSKKIKPNFDRKFYGTAVIGFNIYVIGGCSVNYCLKSCRCFNAVSKTWCEVSPMHERRTHLSVAVLDELVYAMGGTDYSYIKKTAERYDYRTNRWSMIVPMNKRRKDASATTLYDKVYVVGGLNDYGYLNSAEVYDPKVNQWTSISNMISARCFLSCIAYHGYVYAIGGYNDTCGMRSGEKYNPTKNAWVQIADMSRTRENFNTVVLGDTIYAIGGGILNGVECYDEKSNEWSAARDMDIRGFHPSVCVIIGLPNICDRSIKEELEGVYNFLDPGRFFCKYCRSYCK